MSTLRLQENSYSLNSKPFPARRVVAWWNRGSTEGYCNSSNRKWTLSDFRDASCSLKYTWYHSMLKVHGIVPMIKVSRLRCTKFSSSTWSYSRTSLLVYSLKKNKIFWHGNSLGWQKGAIYWPHIFHHRKTLFVDVLSSYLGREGVLFKDKLCTFYYKDVLYLWSCQHFTVTNGLGWSNLLCYVAFKVLLFVFAALRKQATSISESSQAVFSSFLASINCFAFCGEGFFQIKPDFGPGFYFPNGY